MARKIVAFAVGASLEYTQVLHHDANTCPGPFFVEETYYLALSSYRRELGVNKFVDFIVRGGPFLVERPEDCLANRDAPSPTILAPADSYDPHREEIGGSPCLLT